MKGYYIHFGARRWAGVAKKIDMQIQELRKYFNLEEIEIKQNKRSLLRKVYELLPFVTGKKYDLKLAYDRIENSDFLYVRAIWSDNQYISFFKTIKEFYPKCKIIVEIPTYPYDKDIQKKMLLRDVCSRRKYKKYVDVIATYSMDQEIFGLPTINIENGIDVNSMQMVTGTLDREKIRLIAVSTMLKNHGYERILQGLGNYYDNGGQRNIQIFMVGDGPERKYYESIVRRRKLEKNVIFYGRKTGKELDEIYNMSDIALTSFGFYKIDVYRMSALKTRECLAKGLPMVNGCVVDIFENMPYKYSYDFPNDDSIIDIQKIVDFYDRVYKNKEKFQVVDEIRKLAYEKVDISVTLLPIVNYIRDAR